MDGYYWPISAGHLDDYERLLSSFRPVEFPRKCFCETGRSEAAATLLCFTSAKPWIRINALFHV
jgi:hypothetical protein